MSRVWSMAVMVSPGSSGQDVHDGRAPGGAACLGDAVALAAVHLARIGEEEEVVVGGGNEQPLHIVLLLQGLGGDAAAAALLGAVGGRGQALDIAQAREGVAASLLLDEVFDVDFVLHVLDLGEAVVAVFLPDLQELVLENGLDLIFVGQDLLIIGDLLLPARRTSAWSFSFSRPWRRLSCMSRMAWACTSERPKRCIRLSLALS